MNRRSALAAPLAVLLAAVALVIARPAVSEAAAPVRIMPLGDSITGSPGCWRSVLWNRLRAGGHTDIDFVGTLGPQGCAQAYDGDNEGHGGALVTTVANDNLLPGWLAASRPDIVLMHFGTNDVWSNRPTATILAAYTRLVAQMRASNPRMRILVAKIIPMNPPTCAECGQRTVALNAAIPDWAAATGTAQSPVVVVDQWTGFGTATDTYDGVHPNSGGDAKIADRWLPALTAALAGTTPSVPPTTPASPTPSSPAPSSPAPSTTGPTTPPPAGGCDAGYVVAGQWQGAFQGEVSVRNTSAAPRSGWTVRFMLTGGQRITQSWNATVVQNGAEVTARPVGWNTSLAAGQSVTWGFIASGSANPAPTPVCSLG